MSANEIIFIRRVETFLEGRGKMPVLADPRGYWYLVLDQNPNEPIARIEKIRELKNMEVIGNILICVNKKTNHRRRLLPSAS